MNYKVSVILPIYNGEKTLARTLESLFTQTYQDFELVVCIDGSKDSSLQIVNECIPKFKRVVISGILQQGGIGKLFIYADIIKTYFQYILIPTGVVFYKKKQLHLFNKIETKMENQFYEYAFMNSKREEHLNLVDYFKWKELLKK